MNDQLNTIFQQKVAEHNVIGAVAALRDAAGNWYHLSAGQRLPHAEERPNPHGWFPIFSISKTVIAAVCLRLFAAHAISLDTPLRRWWDDRRISDAVTLRRLLNHTSGLPDYGALAAYHNAVQRNPSQPWTTAQIIELAFDHGQWGVIGTWRYANPNYWLLGHIIEQVSGQDLRSAVQTWFLEPAGIAELAYPPADVTLEPRYGMYREDDPEHVIMADDYNTLWAGAAGAIVGSAAGIAQIPIALCEGSLLTVEQRTAMLDVVPLPGDFPPGVTVGCGCGIYNQQTNTALGSLVGHGGGGPGCRTLVKYSLEQQIVAAVISNCERTDPDYLLMPLLKHMAGMA